MFKIHKDLQQPAQDFFQNFHQDFVCKRYDDDIDVDPSARLVYKSLYNASVALSMYELFDEKFDEFDPKAYDVLYGINSDISNSDCLYHFLLPCFAYLRLKSLQSNPPHHEEISKKQCLAYLKNPTDIIVADNSLSLVSEAEVLNSINSEFVETSLEIETEIPDDIVKIDTEEFTKAVLGVFYNNVGIWLRTQYFVDKFKITPQEFYTWAKDRKNILVNAHPKNTGEFVYKITHATIDVPKFGTKESVVYLVEKVFDPNAKKIWKSEEYLCEVFNVENAKEKDEFGEWLGVLPQLCWRVSRNDEDKYLYTLFEFLEAKTVARKRYTPKKETNYVNVPASDYLMFGQLHSCTSQLLKIMEKYANNIGIRDNDMMSSFSQAQRHLLSGLAVLKHELKIKDEDLTEL